MPLAPRNASPLWLCALLTAAVGAAVLAAAWISDDALVTFRTVENFVAGDGIRWNAADRAQTQTHPLWVLLLGAARWCAGEIYLTAIVLSLALTMAAVWLLTRMAPSRGAAVAAAMGALASATFVEFGTCGLENALVYLLTAAFARAWLLLPPGERRLRALGLWAALLALGRQDLVLLVLPCVLVAARGVPLRRAVRALLPGAGLGGAWYVFAWVYFGTVVPTPGYSKVLALDLPGAALLQQGLWYLLDLVRRDPASAATLLGAMVLAAWRRKALVSAPALGVLLQVVYTLRVGGDFMSGRFFTAAFVVALAVVTQIQGRRVAIAMTVAYALLMVAPGWPSFARGTPRRSEARIEHGIGNERAYYAEQLGLWSPGRAIPPYASFGQPFAGRARPPVIVVTAAGIPGYVFGPYAHLVDPFLCDPLLVRLPIEDPAAWRIGHFKRRIPEGYLETLASGDNRIVDPDLAHYWDALSTLLRAPVWSTERWRVWWGFQTGAYNEGLRRYAAGAYHIPPLVHRRAQDLTAAPGAHWYDVPCVVVREGGLRLSWDTPQQGRAVDLLLDGGGVGELTFCRGELRLASLPFVIASDLVSGARWVHQGLPDGVPAFDAVEIHLQRSAADDAADAVTVLDVFAVMGVKVGQ